MLNCRRRPTRQAGARLVPARVAEYLLLDRIFPRAVLHCLTMCLEVVRDVSGPFTGPERTLGRLCAELSFFDVSDVGGAFCSTGVSVEEREKRSPMEPAAAATSSVSCRDVAASNSN